MTNLPDDLLSLLTSKKVFFEASNALSTSQFSVLLIPSSDWLQLGTAAHTLQYRWVAIWACHINQAFQINGCFEKAGRYLLVRTTLAENTPEINSLTALYPAANRAERHLHDMFGVIFTGHPNLIRWTRHQAWNATEFPLRKDFQSSTLAEKNIPGDSDYPFAETEGDSVCEVPVGPVHAGIIEPGHFRFHVAGEAILNLEERLGYVHKGIEKLAEGREVDGLIRLAGRVSGDSTVAHAWAACKACEHAAQVEIPERALFIRGIMAERERIANHLGDIGAICNDVGFAFAYYQFSRLRELWQRVNAIVFGHRLMMDCIIFGGVKIDLSDENIERIGQQISLFRKEVTELFNILDSNNSLQDRLQTTGILTPKVAKKLGAVGYLGRASDCPYDLRRDLAYAPYHQANIHVPVFMKGDVTSRIKVRSVEILVSLNLLDEFIKKLPQKEIIETKRFVLNYTEGVGLVEGWRGEILTYVSFDPEGRVSRFFPRDPSWFYWPALEQLIQNDIIPDFPVCNKSVNGSYSGHDL